MPTQEPPAPKLLVIIANAMKNSPALLCRNAQSATKSHVCDCGLVPQPTQENRGYGYLMMSITIFGCKPNRAAQACPGQATGRVLPRCLFGRFSKGQAAQ
jgi:hypothetical protein